MRRRAFSAAALLLFFASRPAQAHLVTTGLGPFYDGAAHLAKSPGDLAILIALTLLGSMRGPATGRGFLALLPVAWLAGGEIGLALPSTADLDWVGALCFLLAGALVAADRNLSLKELGPLGAAMGAIPGYFTGSALSLTPSSQLALFGSVMALLVVVTLVAGVVVSIRAYWARIAVRVLGSWIAATGLLMLGWILRASR